MKNKKLISKLGYRDDSPYRDRSYIDIHTPDGSIDMSQTGIPLWANGRILPPYSGIHQFDTNVVREIPLAQKGLVQNEECVDGECEETNEVQRLLNEESKLRSDAVNFGWDIYDKMGYVEGQPEPGNAEEIFSKHGMIPIGKRLSSTPKEDLYTCAYYTGQPYCNIDPTINPRKFLSNYRFRKAVEKGELPFTMTQEITDPNFDYSTLSKGDILSIKKAKEDGGGNHMMLFSHINDDGEPIFLQSDGSTGSWNWRNKNYYSGKKGANTKIYQYTPHSKKIAELEEKARTNPEYIEVELTDDEIEEYRKGGYVVEELPRAQTGKYIKEGTKNLLGTTDDLIQSTHFNLVDNLRSYIFDASKYKINNIPNYISKGDINNVINDNIKYLTSDYYFNQRAKNTGESFEQINKEVNFYLSELQKTHFNFGEKLDDASGIIYKPDKYKRIFGDKTEINIENLNNKEKTLNVLDHELKHLFSPAGLSGEKRLYKNFPHLEIDRNFFLPEIRSLNPVKRIKEGFDADQEVLYNSWPWEQQVRFTKFKDYMNQHGVPYSSDYNINDIKKFALKMQEQPGNPNWDVMQMLQTSKRGPKSKGNKSGFKYNDFKTALDNSWMTIPTIGLSATIPLFNEQDGGQLPKHQKLGTVGKYVDDFKPVVNPLPLDRYIKYTNPSFPINPVTFSNKNIFSDQFKVELLENQKNITADDIKNLGERTRKRLMTDKFIENNMKATGRSREEVIKSINELTNEFNTSKLTFKYFEPTSTGGRYRGDGTIDINTHNWDTDSKEYILGKVEHEIEHLFSDQFTAPQGEKIYKNFPALKLSGSAREDLHLPAEQQARLRKGIRWMEDHAGLKSGDKITSEHVNKLGVAMNNWDSKKISGASEFEGSGGATDVRELLSVIDYNSLIKPGQMNIDFYDALSRGSSFGQTHVPVGNKDWVKHLTDVFNNVYTMPAAIGAGSILFGEEEELDTDRPEWNFKQGGQLPKATEGLPCPPFCPSVFKGSNKFGYSYAETIAAGANKNMFRHPQTGNIRFEPKPYTQLHPQSFQFNVGDKKFWEFNKDMRLAMGQLYNDKNFPDFNFSDFSSHTLPGFKPNELTDFTKRTLQDMMVKKGWTHDDILKYSVKNLDLRLDPKYGESFIGAPKYNMLSERGVKPMSDWHFQVFSDNVTPGTAGYLMDPIRGLGDIDYLSNTVNLGNESIASGGMWDALNKLDIPYEEKVKRFGKYIMNKNNIDFSDKQIRSGKAFKEQFPIELHGSEPVIDNYMNPTGELEIFMNPNPVNTQLAKQLRNSYKLNKKGGELPKHQILGQVERSIDDIMYRPKPFTYIMPKSISYNPFIPPVSASFINWNTALKDVSQGDYTNMPLINKVQREGSNHTLRLSDEIRKLGSTIKLENQYDLGQLKKSLENKGLKKEDFTLLDDYINDNNLYGEIQSIDLANSIHNDLTLPVTVQKLYEDNRRRTVLDPIYNDVVPEEYMNSPNYEYNIYTINTPGTPVIGNKHWKDEVPSNINFFRTPGTFSINKEILNNYPNKIPIPYTAAGPTTIGHMRGYKDLNDPTHFTVIEDQSDVMQAGKEGKNIKEVLIDPSSENIPWSDFIKSNDEFTILKDSQQTGEKFEIKYFKENNNWYKQRIVKDYNVGNIIDEKSPIKVSENKVYQTYNHANSREIDSPKIKPYASLKKSNKNKFLKLLQGNKNTKSKDKRYLKLNTNAYVQQLIKEGYTTIDFPLGEMATSAQGSRSNYIPNIKEKTENVLKTRKENKTIYNQKQKELEKIIERKIDDQITFKELASNVTEDRQKIIDKYLNEKYSLEELAKKHNIKLDRLPDGSLSGRTSYISFLQKDPKLNEDFVLITSYLDTKVPSSAFGQGKKGKNHIINFPGNIEKVELSVDKDLLKSYTDKVEKREKLNKIIELDTKRIETLRSEKKLLYPDMPAQSQHQRNYDGSYKNFIQKEFKPWLTETVDEFGYPILRLKVNPALINKVNNVKLKRGGEIQKLQHERNIFQKGGSLPKHQIPPGEVGALTLESIFRRPFNPNTWKKPVINYNFPLIKELELGASSLVNPTRFDVNTLNQINQVQAIDGSTNYPFLLNNYPLMNIDPKFIEEFGKAASFNPHADFIIPKYGNIHPELAYIMKHNPNIKTFSDPNLSWTEFVKNQRSYAEGEGLIIKNLEGWDPVNQRDVSLTYNVNEGIMPNVDPIYQTGRFRGHPNRGVNQHNHLLGMTRNFPSIIASGDRIFTSTGGQRWGERTASHLANDWDYPGRPVTQDWFDKLLGQKKSADWMSGSPKLANMLDQSFGINIPLDNKVFMKFIHPKRKYQSGGQLPTQQLGGEYMDLDLTEDEIKNFKNSGFVVEDLPKAQKGGSIPRFQTEGEVRYNPMINYTPQNKGQYYYLDENGEKVWMPIDAKPFYGGAYDEHGHFQNNLKYDKYTKTEWDEIFKHEIPVPETEDQITKKYIGANVSGYPMDYYRGVKEVSTKNIVKPIPNKTAKDGKEYTTYMYSGDNPKNAYRDVYNNVRQYVSNETEEIGIKNNLSQKEIKDLNLFKLSNINVLIVDKDGKPLYNNKPKNVLSESEYGQVHGEYFKKAPDGKSVPYIHGKTYKEVINDEDLLGNARFQRSEAFDPIREMYNQKNNGTWKRPNDEELKKIHDNIPDELDRNEFYNAKAGSDDDFFNWYLNYKVNNVYVDKIKSAQNQATEYDKNIKSKNISARIDLKRDKFNLSMNDAKPIMGLDIMDSDRGANLSYEPINYEGYDATTIDSLNNVISETNPLLSTISNPSLTDNPNFGSNQFYKLNPDASRGYYRSDDGYVGYEFNPSDDAGVTTDVLKPISEYSEDELKSVSRDSRYKLYDENERIRSLDDVIKDVEENVFKDNWSEDQKNIYLKGVFENYNKQILGRNFGKGYYNTSNTNFSDFGNQKGNFEIGKYANIDDQDSYYPFVPSEMQKYGNIGSQGFHDEYKKTLTNMGLGWLYDNTLKGMEEQGVVNYKNFLASKHAGTLNAHQDYSDAKRDFQNQYTWWDGLKDGLSNLDVLYDYGNKATLDFTGLSGPMFEKYTGEYQPSSEGQFLQDGISPITGLASWALNIGGNAYDMIPGNMANYALNKMNKFGLYDGQINPYLNKGRGSDFTFDKNTGYPTVNKFTGDYYTPSWGDVGNAAMLFTGPILRGGKSLFNSGRNLYRGFTKPTTLSKDFMFDTNNFFKTPVQNIPRKNSFFKNWVLYPYALHDASKQAGFIPDYKSRFDMPGYEFNTPFNNASWLNNNNDFKILKQDFKEGGEYELTDTEIKRLAQEGYEVEYID